MTRRAAAIAGLAELAPGRVAVGVGTGFTGRMVLGQRPVRWSEVAEYVRVLRAFLRGESVEWEGSMLRMLQPPGFGARRPVEVPVLIGANGPRGLAVADEVGDGVLSARVPQPVSAGGPAAWRSVVVFGTVLDEGEDATSPRAQAAAAHAVAVKYHTLYERGGPDQVDQLPGGGPGGERSRRSVPHPYRAGHEHVTTTSTSRLQRNDGLASRRGRRRRLRVR
jgi:5,10-methylenetetrahydromethanopterin reductase